MPLPWVRLDSTFPTHDKVLDLVGRGNAGYRAGFVYACSLAHCGAQGTDGLITFAALPFIHGRRSDAELLVHVALWKPHPLGWEIPNWSERQQSSGQRDAIIASRRRGAVKANCIRWHGPDCGCWSDPE